MKWLFPKFPAVLLAVAACLRPAAVPAQTNGNFENAALPFPSGWTAAGTVTSVASIVPAGTASARMEAGASIHQDIAPLAVDALTDFELNLAFRTGTLSDNNGNSAQNRIRIRGNNNAPDIISLGFSSDALRTFMGTWADDLTGITIPPDTTCYLRLTGREFNLPSRSYTLGFSTDGINYTTSAPSTRFHGGAGTALETIRFEGNGASFTVDNITVGELLPVDAPVIHWFTASPDHVGPGNPATLSWSVSAADSLVLSPGGPPLTATSTSATVTPAATTTYTLTATNAGGSVSKTFTLGVGGNPQPLTISEFMAANTTGLTDDDGDHSDWLEIHNPNPWSVNAAGLALTDRPAQPDLWIFPNLTIAPGDYAVVFASSKNRTAPGKPLHTNFNLAASGEYLALIDRNGAILQEFAPAFPPQNDNISTDGITFFATPTPGAPNLPGPSLDQPAWSKNPDGSWRITVHTVDATSVTLLHRTQYLTEQSLTMTALGAGYFEATLPAPTAAPGQMLRWYFRAADAASRTARLPAFTTPDSPQYLGTAVPNPTVPSSPGVFEWFMDPAFNSAADSLTGARCSVAWLGQFYDNVLVHLRGATTANFVKKPHKFEFHSSQPFRFRADLPRVDEININAAFSDGSYLRDYLAHRDLLAAGVPAPSVEPVRVQRNGTLHSLGVMIENVDSRFLRRHNLDDSGPLFKATGNGSWLTGTTGFETRNGAVLTDLAAFTSAIAPTNPARPAWLYDHVNLPAVVSYLAANVLGSIYNPQKNYYAFLNSRKGEWQIIPWDRDFAYGDIFLGAGDSRYPSGGAATPIISNERIEHAASNEDLRGGMNRLFEAIMSTPSTRAMFYRRLRTLLDGHFAPGNIEGILNEWQPRLKTLADADRQLWGYAPGAGGPYAFRADPFDTAVDRIRNTYLPARRSYLLSNNTTPTNGVPPSATWMRGSVPPPQSADPAIIIQSAEPNPASGNQEEEYIEIRNTSAGDADLSGWSLSGGARHTLQPGTVIPAGGSLFLTPNILAFRARSTSPKGGESRLAQGNYDGHLSNFAETLLLKNAAGSTVSTFVTPDQPGPLQRWLVISEMMYHPPEPWPDAEFIELHNTSPILTLDLAGATFSAGISFTFPPGSTLAPGARTILILDPAAFAAAHPAFTGTISGTFTSGRLSNTGETVKLDDATGSTIAEITYGNTFPWPDPANGGGSSLTLIASIENPLIAQPASWRVSLASGGSPGTSDSTRWDGTLPETLLQPAPNGTHLVVNIPLTADNVTFVPEFSGSLTTWSRDGFTPLADLPATVPGTRRASWLLPAGGIHGFVRVRILPR